MDIEYRQRPELSQSSLKNLLKHPYYFVNTQNKESESLTLGSVVDTLLLTPEDFDDTYYVGEAPTPPEAPKAILEDYYQFLEDSPVKPDEDEQNTKLLELAKQYKYCLTYGDEAVLKKINNYEPYLQFLNESKGKKLIGPDQYEKYNNIVNVIKNDSLWLDNIAKYNYICQLDIYWSHDNVGLKSLLDIVIIDDKNKTIQPYDLKTTSKPLVEFLDKKRGSFWVYGYDIQASFYMHALQEAYPEYTILPFRFYVVNTTTFDSIIYIVDDEVLEEAEASWKYAIELYKWHSKNGIWDYTKDVYESGRIITVTKEV